MAFEVPRDLIQQVQILLRTHSGLPKYDPNDPSLPSLPSLEDSISQFEPSPPYLRCKHCKGKLLRGLESLICVYCGEELKKEVPPEALKFKSTVGYRWLLDALKLDGSEKVGPSIEENEPSRGQNTQKDEIALSDLLDLEIKWPDESERVGVSVTSDASVQSKASLNLAGVDLDYFFSESKRDSTTDVSKEQLDPNTQIRNIDSDALQGHKHLNLFENVQPSETVVQSSMGENGEPFSGWNASSTESNLFQGRQSLSLFENVESSMTAAKPSVDDAGDGFSGREMKGTESNSSQGGEDRNLFDHVRLSETAVRSTDNESGDRFSGWESEFQSANSGTLQGESSSFDSFVGSTVDLSMHMDTIFGSGKDVEDEKIKDVTASASMTNDLIEDDLWTNLNSSISNQVELSEAAFKMHDGGTLDSANYSSARSVDWLQDNQWQTSSSKPLHIHTVDDDDSFDAWNDFTSSTSTKKPPDSSLKQTDVTSTTERTSELNILKPTNNLQGIEFGTVEQPDFFVGASSDQNGSKEANTTLSEPLVSDRIPHENAKDGGNLRKIRTGDDDVLNATRTSRADDVEMLMSQMHDVSFMLENNLSIPKS